MLLNDLFSSQVHIIVGLVTASRATWALAASARRARPAACTWAPAGKPRASRSAAAAESAAATSVCATSLSLARSTAASANATTSPAPDTKASFAQVKTSSYKNSWSCVRVTYPEFTCWGFWSCCACIEVEVWTPAVERAHLLLALKLMRIPGDIKHAVSS